MMTRGSGNRAEMGLGRFSGPVGESVQDHFGKWSEAAVNGALNILRNKGKSIKAVTRGVYAVK